MGDCESSDCRYGLIDKRGEFILPAEYEELNDPTEGLYLAAKDSKYGFVNAKGETMVSFKYTDALPFARGLRSSYRWQLVFCGCNRCAEVHQSLYGLQQLQR
ncbi:MAG: WG repeat-containing protein [Bacteroidetes bacterium]|nr:WG repeat-containing protein [Bacteroidota bacterium]